MSKKSHKSHKQSKLCVCSRAIAKDDTHTYCFVCLGEEHAVTALQTDECEHCESFSIKMLRARRDYFISAPKNLKSWGSQMDLADEQETGESSSFALSPDPCIPSHDPEAHSGASSVHVGDDNDDDDDFSLGSADFDKPASERSSRDHGSVEELLEVVTRAVARLQIDWPREPETPKRSKLGDRFLSTDKGERTKHEPLPFFEDLHGELNKSWKRPYTSRVFVPSTSVYSTIVGAKTRGYTEMPQVEETLASYLSPGSASSLKKPILPTKPCRITSSLVGKAYQAAGQAGAALHTMAVLQAYQADLLKDLSGGETIDREAFDELRRATDLSLRATKQTARAIGRSMSALKLKSMRRLLRSFCLAAHKGRGYLSRYPDLFPVPRDPGTQRKRAWRVVLPREELGDRLAALNSPPEQTSGLLLTGKSSPDGCIHSLELTHGSGRIILHPIAPSRCPYETSPPPPPLGLRGEAVSSQMLKAPCSPSQVLKAPCSPIPNQKAGLLTSPQDKVLKLIPLSESLAAWKLLPGISGWVISTVHLGYRIQFIRRPPRFNGVIFTSVRPERTQILLQEIQSLLMKGAIEHVPLPERESGYYSRYFLVPKKDGGLRPILDLRALNKAVKALKFKMLTVKTVVAQIQHYDWFVTIDLKDAYFHIEILPQHRKFLRFAFAGEAYQFRVLPFGLALSPRTYTKCMDAALAPLRLRGIRILNYIDDWLILARSREVALQHRDVVLAHLLSLGLRLNAKKSVLSPAQRTTYLGIVWDSITMRAHLSPARIATIQHSLSRLRLGQDLTVKQYQRILGLMASASTVIPLGLLHMRPFQLWLRAKGFHPRANPQRLIKVTRRGLRALTMWIRPRFLALGPTLGATCRRRLLTTDASLTGWGAILDGRPAQGEWEGHQLSWHINCLELMAVFLALKYFLPQLRGCHVLVRVDNTATVSYINHQGGLRSRNLNRLARQIFLWAQDKILSLRAVYIPGNLNVEADLLSRQTLLTGEWRLHPDIVSQIWTRFYRAEVDLFASFQTAQCPLYFSLSPPAPLGLDAMAHTWPNKRLYAFPPVALLPQVLARVRQQGSCLLLIAPRWPNRVWFSEMISLLNGSPWAIPERRDLLSQAGGTIFHPRPDLWNLHVWPLKGTN
ncbi:uncharacterized protein [Misgurnus anguillicaudatus]|uniref:uncharacterized protein n=1 Tax=Misgurnus anguillicaudatus TaxID=75329 RepID=UPI003CCF1123